MAKKPQKTQPSPLYKAIVDRDVKTFKKLLAEGIDVNAPVMGHKGAVLPLPLAIESNADDIAVALIDAGADITRTDLNLAWAVLTARPHIVRRFIDAGADLNTDTRMGSPLSIAAAPPACMAKVPQETLNEMTRMLIEAGADVNARGVLGTTLFWAMYKNRTEPVKLLLAAGASLEWNPGDRGGYVLAQAVQKRNREVVSALLGAGADPTATDLDGVSALQWAERTGQPELLALLTEGAKRETPLQPPTPEDELMISAERGELARVRELLSGGAEANSRDRRSQTLGFTPLMLAAAAGHVEIVSSLLDAGADPNAVDDERAIAGLGSKREDVWHWRSGLARAAEGGHLAAVQALLRRGADVNSRDAAGATPLSLAAAAAKQEVIAELLAAGADPNLASAGRQTPLMLAASGGNTEIIRLLLEAGGNPEAKDGDGDTALIKAALQARPEAVAVLLKHGAKATGQKGARALYYLIFSGKADEREPIPGLPPPEQRVPPTLRLLMEAGADPNTSPGQHREAPISLARRLSAQSKWFAEILAIMETTAPADSARKTPREKTGPARKPTAVKPSSTDKASQQPDFSAPASRPEYQQALADLEKLCGTPRHDLGIPGGYSLHVNSQSPFDLDEAHADLLSRGCYVFSIHATDHNRIAILPTADKYAVIAAMGTNGANYDLAPEDIIAWLREFEKRQPFVLTGIGFDFLAGRLTTRISDPEALAKRMYEFCPDIVDQGTETVDELARELRESGQFFLWWD